MIFKPKKWQRFDFNPFEDQLPTRELAFSGNYAIIVDGVLNYIGKSSRIAGRLQEHDLAIGFSLNSKMQIAVRKESNSERSDVERSDVEQKLINRLKPIANKRIVIPFDFSKEYYPDNWDDLIKKLITYGG